MQTMEELFFRFDGAVFFLKFFDQTVDHIYQLTIFGAALILGNVLELFQLLGIHPQGVSAFVILHFVISTECIDKILDRE